MSVASWVRALFNKFSRKARRRSSLRKQRRSLTLERLEDRITPSTTGVLDKIQQFGNTAVSNAFVIATATDNGGNLVVAGQTDGTLPSQTSAAGTDAFVLKYDPSGNVLWTSQFGTSSWDEARAAAVDGSGNIYVAGYTGGNLQGTNAGSDDVFVRKFDSAGTVVWTQQFGSNSYDDANAVAVDSAGNVYVAGTTGGNLQGTNAGSNDAFVTKLDSAGALQWTQQFGTSNSDGVNAITVYGTDSIYVAGQTYGALQGASAGAGDAFVRKYDGAGNVQWTQQYGSSGYDAANGLATDRAGNLFVAGYVGAALPGQTSAGGYDAYVQKIDGSGNVQWTQQFGSSGYDFGSAVTVDSSGNVYVGGYTQGNLQGTKAGSDDAFVRKFTNAGAAQWTWQLGSSGDDIAQGIAVDGTGNIFLAGYTNGALPGQTRTGGYDGFVAKFSDSNAPPAVFATNPVLTSGELPAGTTSLTVDFNQTVTGADQASNYTLQSVGPDGLLGTSDDGNVPINSVSFTGTAATLHFASLAEGVYRLTVKAAITNSDGTQQLDGTGDGTGGDDYVRDFVVSANAPANLTSPNNFTFDVQPGGDGSGQLVQGANNAFDGLNRLQVGGTDFTPTANVIAPETVTRAASASNYTNDPSTFTWILGTTVTLSQSETVRLDASFNLSTNADNYVGLEFMVDGVAAAPARYVEPNHLYYANSTVTTNLINDEEEVTLGPGSHTINLAWDVSNTGYGAATLSSPTLTVSVPTIIPNVGPSEAGARVATQNSYSNNQYGFAPIDAANLSKTITLSQTETVRLDAMLTLGTTPYNEIGLEFLVDGVAAAPPHFLEPNAPYYSNSAYSYNLVNDEEAVTLGPGSHTITVAWESIGSTYYGNPVILSPTLTVSVPALIPGVGSAQTVARAATQNTYYDYTTSFVPIDAANLATTITLSQTETVRLDAALDLSTAPYNQVGLEFLVDGSAVGSPRFFEPNAPYYVYSNDYATNIVNDEEEVTLGPGTHTITVAWNSNNYTYYGEPYISAINGGTSAALTVTVPTYAPVLTDSGQTYTTNTQTLAGLNVSRQVTVPSSGSQDFARTVDSFQNPTDSPITTTVHIVGNLGSDTATQVFATSAGDTTPSTSDEWIGTDGGAGTTAVISIIHGPDGLKPTSVDVSADNIEWTYTITVAAHSTLELGTFTIQASTEANAISEANALLTPTGFGGTAEYPTTGSLAALANFQFNTPPTPSAGGPYLITEGNAVTLDASGSADSDGDTLSYSWTINGHAAAALGVNPTVSWATLQSLGVDDSTSTFPISVSVDDGHGHVATADTTLQVNDAAPVANAGGSYQVVVNNLVSLDGSASNDADEAITSYLWHFGDSSTDQTTASSSTQYTYSAPGTYQGTLTVTDADGLTNATNFTVTVAPPAPAAPTLDAGSDTGTVGDDITEDTTPQIDGTAYPNSSITLYDNRSGAPVSIGTATADGNGNWHTTVTLGNGVHSITAQATNNGVTGAMSSAESLTILTPLIYNASTVTAYTLHYNTSDSDLEIVDTNHPSTILTSQPLAYTTGVNIIGISGGSDTLTIDYGSYFSVRDGISDNGGGGGALDVSGSTFASITDNATGTGAGNLVLHPAAGSDNTVTYSGLAPITITSTSTEVTINLPAGTQDAVLKDSGTNGMETLSATGNSFESLTIADPTGTLYVNGTSGAAEKLQVQALNASFDANLAINLQGGGNDEIDFTAAQNLSGANNISATAQTITDSAAPLTTGGNITFVAGSTLTLSAKLSAGGNVALTTTKGDLLQTGGDIAATGTVTLNTPGSIGSSSQRIDFDATNTPSSVIIGSTLEPSAAYLDGLGSLTLGNVFLNNGQEFINNGPLDVIAQAALTIAQHALIETGYGAISLAADVNADGSGNSNTAQLSIQNGAVVGSTKLSSSAITLRGYDLDIATGADPASVGTVPVLGTSAMPFVTNVPGAPYSLAFDKSGNLFIASLGSNTVSEVPAGTSSATPFLTGSDGLDRPVALAFDASGNLFIANFGSDTVSEVPAGTHTVVPFITSGLSEPYALAFDASGNLFIANYRSDMVSEVAAGSSSATPFVTGLPGPQGLAFDKSGNLFIANVNNTVSEVAAGSHTATLFLTSTVSNPYGLYGLAFDNSGNLYLTNTGNNTVSEVAAGSSTETPFLTSGLNNPLTLTFDTKGDLWMGTGNDTVSEVSTVLTPLAGGVVIRSAQSSAPMNIGSDINDVAGINLSAAELAQIRTRASGVITFGDSQQTGDITFQGATPATTPAAATVAQQSATGAGHIILDNAAGTATALDGNTGAILLSAGMGGIVEAASNTPAAADISNTNYLSLTSAGAIGSSSAPLQLSATTLNSDTSANNSNQYLAVAGTAQLSLPTEDISALNAGSGTITLASGTLQIPTGSSMFNSALAIADTSSLKLARAATLDLNGNRQTLSGLSGTGSVANTAHSTATLTIDSSGFISPGASFGSIGAGILHVGSNLAFNAKSAFDVDLNSTGAGTGYDQLDVTGSGTISLNGSTLNLALGTSFAASTASAGTTFDIIKNEAGNAISGAFANLSEGSTLILSGQVFSISYIGGAGHDVVLTYLGPVMTFSVSTAANGNLLNAMNTITVHYLKDGVATTATIWDGHSVSDEADAGSTVTYDQNSSGSGTTERWEAPATPRFTVSLSTTATTATYYDQLDDTLQASTATGGNAMTSSNDVTANLTQFNVGQSIGIYDSFTPSAWLDRASMVTFSANSSAPPAHERWQANANDMQPTFTVSSATTLAATYYDQLDAIFTPLTATGGTPLSAANFVTVRYAQFAGTINNGTHLFDGSGVTAWADRGSSASFSAASSNSANTERWQANAADMAATATVSSTSVTATYYDQLAASFAATTANGTPLSSTNYVTATYTQFGASFHDTTDKIFDGNSLQGAWVDLGGTASLDSTSTGSTMTERWQAQSQPSLTVSAGTTSVSGRYFDQLDETFQALLGTGGNTMAGTVAADYVRFGSAVSQNFSNVSSASAWTDRASTITFDQQSSGSSSTERWRTATQPSFAATTANGTTLSATYFDQLTEKFAATVAAPGKPLSATNYVKSHYTQFGTTVNNSTPIYDTTTHTLIDWADRATTAALDLISSGSTSTEIWEALGQPTLTVTIPATLTGTYYDETAPLVTNITATTANGSYKAGATIALTITFNEKVIVTGTPQLALNSGGAASYSGGSANNTLTFTYVVAAGQNSSKLDYVSTTALTLQGGTIKDISAGIDATLTLPAPASTHSLSGNKDIVILTKGPALKITAAPNIYTDTQTKISVVGMGDFSTNGTVKTGDTIKVVITDNANYLKNPAAGHSTAPATATVTYNARLKQWQWSAGSINASGLNNGTVYYIVTETDAAGNVTTVMTSAAKSKYSSRVH